MPVLVFLAVLERILEFIIPASVAWMALRRLIHCPGYDRLYYGYVLFYCLAAIWLLPESGARDIEAYILRYMAFSTLPLWFLVLYETDGPARYRQTPNSGRKRPGRANLSPPPLRLESPIPSGDPQFRSTRDDVTA